MTNKKQTNEFHVVDIYEDGLTFSTKGDLFYIQSDNNEDIDFVFERNEILDIIQGLQWLIGPK